MMFSRCVEMVEKNSHLSLQHLRIASKRELSKVLVMQGNEEEALLLFEQYLGLTISVARRCAQILLEMLHCLEMLHPTAEDPSHTQPTSV